MGRQGGGGQSGGGGGHGGGRGGQISGGESRIILCAFPSPMTEECNSLILKMRGIVLGSIDYKTATHIDVPVHAQEGAKLILTAEGKQVINCINMMCYSRGERLPQNHNLGGMRKRRAQKDSREERKERVHKPTSKCAVNGAISTSSSVGCSKRSVEGKLDNGSASAKGYDLGPSVDSEEEVYHKHHQLFVCKKDKSEWTDLSLYYLKGKLTTEIPTPGSGQKHSYGSGQKHSYVTTSNTLKLHVRSSYKLLKSLHKVGFTFRGEFEPENFLVDTYNNMRLGNLKKGVIKKLMVGDSKIDTLRFAGMIEKQIFKRIDTPSDMQQWIYLIIGCEAAFDDLATNYISLMEEDTVAAHFMSLYEMFKNMKLSNRCAYAKVKEDLTNYENWQTPVRGEDGNYFLKKTLNYNDDKSDAEPYEDDISGLLRLLRNTRQHATARERDFARIVGHHFPELMGDFQKAMFKQGYFKRENW